MPARALCGVRAAWASKRSLKHSQLCAWVGSGAERVAEPPVLLAEHRKRSTSAAGVGARRLGEDLEVAGESRHVLVAEKAPVVEEAHARFRRRRFRDG